MLRRIVEGLILAVLVWALAVRFGAGPVMVWMLFAAVAALSVWRIRYVWQRYQAHLAMAERAERMGEGDSAVEREMLALRGQQHGRGAEMTFWTGFILGGAIAADMPTPLQAGEMDDAGVGGLEGGIDIGGLGGGMDGGGM
jgi:hypothetical protein